MMGAITEGPSSSIRFSRRAVTGGDNRFGFRYPSPFFDIAQTYLPTSIKSMLRFCRYYYLTNPLVNSVVWKMAEYPVTDILVETDDGDLHDRYRNLIDNVLNLKSFLIECNLDYGAYGNSFVSIVFPLRKYLVCRGCRHREPVRSAKYRFYSLKYHVYCKKCGEFGEAAVFDDYVRSVNEIKLIRWNPEHMSIQHNPITGDSTYHYTMPAALKNDIRMGKRSLIEKIPHIFVEAVRRNKSVVFTDENLFHLKRPTVASKDMGWGTPMILPVLKDTYYLQILRKAQEAIALDHVVPLRVLFPQAADAVSSPMATIDLADWRDNIEQEVDLWRQDSSRIPVLPLPIGYQSIGGDGRALLLFQEFRLWSEHIIAGMGVPQEFILGGLSWSGSNVSLRMLENQFLTQRSRQRQMLQYFILDKIAYFLDWPRAKVSFAKFRMADDLQRSSYLFQLSQAGKISDQTLLEDVEIDAKQENKLLEREMGASIKLQEKQQLAQAEMQGKMQLVQGRWQMKMQELMAPPGMDPSMMGQDPSMMGQDPMAGGMPGQEGGGAPQGAERGEAEAAGVPGMPEGATAYPENAGGGVGEGMDEMQSPLGLGTQQQQGGVDLIYLAKRAAAQIRQMEPEQAQQALQELRTNNPKFFELVMQLLQQEEGSTEDVAGAPLPEERPPRRGPEASMV